MGRKAEESPKDLRECRRLLDRGQDKKGQGEEDGKRPDFFSRLGRRPRGRKPSWANRQTRPNNGLAPMRMRAPRGCAGPGQRASSERNKRKKQRLRFACTGCPWALGRGGPPEADEGLGRGVLAGGACRRLERTVAGPEIDFFVCDDGRRMRRRGLLGRDGCRDAMRACLAAVMLRW